MLSGFFLAKEIKNKDCSNNILDQTYSCVFSRIWTVYPTFFLSTLIGFAVILFAKRDISAVGRVLGDFLFLSNFGFSSLTATGIVWYLSSLVIALWIVYPIARMKFDVFSSYIAPILSLFIYGFLIYHYEKLDLPSSYYGPFSTGVMRALAGLSVGFVIFQGSCKLKFIIV